MGSHISAAIEVRRSIETVYQQMTRFESFPQFIEGVVEVQQLDDTHLFCRIDVGTATRGLYIAITEQRAQDRVAWRSDDGGPAHSGSLSFQRIGDGATRVTAHMTIDPTAFADKAANRLGLLDRRMRSGLDEFKQFIESEGAQSK